MLSRILPAVAGIVLCACSPSITTSLPPVAESEIRALFLFTRSPIASAGYDGHGFLVDRGTGRQPLGVTVYHVAGAVPLQGPDPQPASVATALLQSIREGQTPVRLGQRIPLPGAQTIDASSSQRDIAAFTVIDWDPTRALTLGDVIPAVGDTVWVLAVHVGDRPDGGPRRHPARVTVSDDTRFSYVYLASANTNFTSGAAVLDRQGRLVGLNAGTITPGGEVVGLAVGLKSIRTYLDAIP